MYNVELNIESKLITLEVKNFIQVSKECAELYAKKNHDYGNSFDQGMERIGIKYGTGRLFDKMNRILNLTDNEAEIKDETLEDNLVDLACYSIMLLAYRKKEKEKRLKEVEEVLNQF